MDGMVGIGGIVDCGQRAVGAGLVVPQEASGGRLLRRWVAGEVPITLPALICGAGPSGTRFGTPTRPTDSSRRFSKGSSWKLCLLGSGSLRLEFNFRSRRFANFAARVLCSVVTVTPHFTTHPPGRLIGKFSLEISVNIRDISLISTLCYHNLLGAATDFVHPPGQ